MKQEESDAVSAFLIDGLASGRLALAARVGGDPRDELYRVTRVEGEGVRQAAPPEVPLGSEDASLTGSLDSPPENGTVAGTLIVRGWARIPGQDLKAVVLLDGDVRPALSRKRYDRGDVAAAVPALVSTVTMIALRFVNREG